MPTEPMHYEMDRLVAYDDDSMLAEVRRVAALIPEPKMTRAAFDREGRVASSTCVRRFGGWRETLERAGIRERARAVTVSDKMRSQSARALTAEQVVQELQRIATLLGRDTLTRHDVQEHSDLLGDRIVGSRFGSWPAALEAAGLQTTAHGRRYVDEDYYENLLTVWTHYGRPPTYAAMRLPPSRITPEGYAKKFGSWGRAKAAFVERVNSDLKALTPSVPPVGLVPEPKLAAVRPEDRRDIPLGLRYAVLRRNRFRCVACGRSPATDLGCELHVDHIVAFSRGGKTREDNLRTLCESCNLGKCDGDA